VIDRGLAIVSSRLLSTALAEVVLSTVVAAVVWLVSRMLRGRWPAFEHGLWVLVLLRLVLPPSLAHPLGAGELLDRIGLGIGALCGRATEPAAFRDATAGVPDASPSAGRPGPPTASGPAPVLLALWAGAVLALVAREAARARACRRVLARASTVSGGAVARLTERGRRRLGICRAVRVVAADAPVSPFTAGLLRPVIFVPGALLARENRHALRAALSHELAHVARWDVGWMRLERWVERLYFFHPVLWLVSRRLHAGRERLCDALAVSRGLLSGPDYVRGLLDTLQLDLQGVEAPSLTVTQRRILMRSRRVLAVRSTSRSRPILAASLAALVGGVLLPLAQADARGQEKPATPAVAGPESPAPPYENPLPSGRVTRRYGEGANPLTGAVELHTGIDLGAPSGTPVVAPADAVVELATTTYAPLEAAGTVVILDHRDGRKTFYSHLSELKVTTGQRVSRGATIGLVGNTGRSTGPHLHFEVWENGRHVDPASLVPDWARPEP
jgi:beta-lactamase regulating signal transducer with metallopeptidase domain